MQACPPGRIRFCHQANKHLTVKVVFNQYHTGNSLKLVITLKEHKRGYYGVMRLIQMKCQCDTGKNDIHSNVFIGLMVPALVSTSALHNEFLCL